LTPEESQAALRIYKAQPHRSVVSVARRPRASAIPRFAGLRAATSDGTRPSRSRSLVVRIATAAAAVKSLLAAAHQNAA
jgi:hypothetical protein